MGVLWTRWEGPTLGQLPGLCSRPPHPQLGDARCIDAV